MVFCCFLVFFLNFLTKAYISNKTKWAVINYFILIFNPCLCFSSMPSLTKLVGIPVSNNLCEIHYVSGSFHWEFSQTQEKLSLIVPEIYLQLNGCSIQSMRKNRFNWKKPQKPGFYEIWSHNEGFVCLEVKRKIFLNFYFKYRTLTCSSLSNTVATISFPCKQCEKLFAYDLICSNQASQNRFSAF